MDEVLLDKICFIEMRYRNIKILKNTEEKLPNFTLFVACFGILVLAILLPVSERYTNAIQNTDLGVFAEKRFSRLPSELQSWPKPLTTL